MVTYDEYNRVIFSDFTDDELMSEIQRRMITMALEGEFTERKKLCDRVHEDIYELYLRLRAAKDRCERLREANLKGLYGGGGQCTSNVKR